MHVIEVGRMLAVMAQFEVPILTVAPVRNPVPARVTVAPTLALRGEIELKIGAGGINLNPLAANAVYPSGFVTVTL